jgi:hypothetical protein
MFDEVYMQLSHITRRSYGTQTSEYIFSTNQTFLWNVFVCWNMFHRNIWSVEYIQNQHLRSIGTFRARANLNCTR